ncbi:MAG: hypothetical protein JXR97_08635 [Planctomycetes bacterium]|nr:hypothetical protein [Planctomycetota bacterium]
MREIHLATGHRIERRGRVVAGALALLSMSLLLCGCLNMDTAENGLAAVGSKSNAYEEWTGDPAALSTITSVAIVPFADRAVEEGFDPVVFSTRLANQLTSKGRLRVVYPKEMLATAERENRRVRMHNSDYRRRKMLGTSAAEERGDQLMRAQGQKMDSVAGMEDRELDTLDPVHNVADAISLGRILKVDAVMIGNVTDFYAYTRPRISLNMTLVSTGVSDTAANEIAMLTQWGVPNYKSTERGKVWFRQQNFDSRDGNVGMGAYRHALLHFTDQTPYSKESYITSITNYYDYVSFVLADALLAAREKSAREAEERAIALAQKNNKDRESVRNRIRTLVNPGRALPDSDAVIANNLADRRDREWRPDVYNKDHPAKEEQLIPEYRPVGNGQ